VITINKISSLKEVTKMKKQEQEQTIINAYEYYNEYGNSTYLFEQPEKITTNLELKIKTHSLKKRNKKELENKLIKSINKQLNKTGISKNLNKFEYIDGHKFGKINTLYELNESLALQKTRLKESKFRHIYGLRNCKTGIRMIPIGTIMGVITTVTGYATNIIQEEPNNIGYAVATSGLALIGLSEIGRIASYFESKKKIKAINKTFKIYDKTKTKIKNATIEDKFNQKNANINIKPYKEHKFAEINYRKLNEELKNNYLNLK